VIYSATEYFTFRLLIQQSNLMFLLRRLSVMKKGTVSTVINNFIFELFFLAQNIWPAANQISYRLYDRSNSVAGQTRPVMIGWPVMTGQVSSLVRAGYLTSHRHEQT